MWKKERKKERKKDKNMGSENEIGEKENKLEWENVNHEENAKKTTRKLCERKKEV